MKINSPLSKKVKEDALLSADPSRALESAKSQMKLDIEPSRFQKERDAFCFGVIGASGAGKSVTAEEIARAWRVANPEGLIVAFDPQQRFRDVGDFFIDIADKDWAKKALDLRNSLLILDEVRILHPKALTSDDLLRLLAMKREYCIDIIYIVHSPQLILSGLTYFTTKYFIFHTEAIFGSFDKKIPRAAAAIGATTFINKYVSYFGGGLHPLDENYNGPKNNGQDFPYIIMDNEDGELTAINMQKERVSQLINLS